MSTVTFASSGPVEAGATRAMRLWLTSVAVTIGVQLVALITSWSTLPHWKPVDAWLILAGLVVAAVVPPAYVLHLRIFRANEPGSTDARRADLTAAATLWLMLTAASLTVAIAAIVRESAFPDVALGMWPTVLLLLSWPEALGLSDAGVRLRAAD